MVPPANKTNPTPPYARSPCLREAWGRPPQPSCSRSYKFVFLTRQAFFIHYFYCSDPSILSIL